MSPLRAARERGLRSHHQAHVAISGRGIQDATISIAGTSYVCAWHEDPVRNVPTMSGYRKEQTATATIAKALLATVPAIGTMLIANDHEWKLDTTAGHEIASDTWTLHLIRRIGT